MKASCNIIYQSNDVMELLATNMKSIMIVIFDISH
jgi:hypothetical protein